MIPLADALRWLLGGVCHQMAAHCFVVHGTALPICARCSGTFTGVLVGLLAWRLDGGPRGTGFPPHRVLLALAGFILAWGLDGLNSFLTLVPGAPSLYAPHNTLRLLTGMLNGLALATLVRPVFNFISWQDRVPGPPTPNLSALVAPTAVLAFVALLAHIGVPIALYGLLLLATAGLLGMLAVINGMGAIVLIGREAHARTWRELVLPLSLGLVAALAEVSALAAVRAWALPLVGFAQTLG